MGFLNKVDLMKKAEGMVFQKQKDTASTTTTPVAAPAPAPKDPAVTALPTASTSTTPATEVSNPVDEDEGEIIDQTGNGTVVRKHRDGHKSTTYPDGRRVHKYVDGSEMTVLPNGTKTYYTPHQPKEDLLDKAVSKGAKSLGFSLSRGTTEKITDKGRGLFEKSTGKKISSKISN